jgi:hypothetical protein
MQQLLEAILTRVVDQVKFAETKNALLATLASATGAALLTTYSIRHQTSWPLVGKMSILAASVLFVAAAFALAALMPTLTNKLVSDNSPKEEPNLFFFEDLKLFNESTLLAAFADALNTPNVERLPIHSHIANQIIVHSRIASQKYRSFRRALATFLFGAALMGATLATELFLGPSQGNSPAGNSQTKPTTVK